MAKLKYKYNFLLYSSQQYFRGKGLHFLQEYMFILGEGYVYPGGRGMIFKNNMGGVSQGFAASDITFLEHKFNFFLLIRCREIYKILGKYLSLIFCLGILSILQYIHASLRLINLFYLEAHFLYNISLKVFTQFQC